MAFQSMIVNFTMLSAIILVAMSINKSAMAATGIPRVINVVNLGARGDGRTDSTQSFQTAWDWACSSSQPATIYVPAGRFFLRSVYFQGQRCQNKNINFRIDGTLLASSDYRRSPSNVWIRFDKVTGVSITGGTLDGQGAALWACKASSTTCPAGANTLEFYNSRNIVITGLTSINSQKFHLVMDGCQNVKLQGIMVSALGSSPNTDGIHIQSSSGVSVLNSRIATGDDCISIGPGSSDIWIESISCGPGHGISIGSLGWTALEAGVQNVTVNGAIFHGSQNGVRIKSWARESSGFVRGVVFQHLTMVNVENPVIIDQQYCPGGHDCPGEESGVRISDVRYMDIHGTSATEVGVKLDCSKERPCSGVMLEDVNLSYKNGAAQTTCVNALGGVVEVIHHNTATTTACLL